MNENNEFNEQEILQEIDELGLDIVKAPCRRCGKQKPVNSLYALPEVCRYTRQHAQFMLGKRSKPALLKEEELQGKYGYGSKDLFCFDCFLDLILDGKDTRAALD